MVKKQNYHHYRLIFICLLLSLVSWFAMKMSKNYTQTYQFEMGFVDIPTGKKLAYQSDTVISLAINAKGLTLLRYELQRKNILIEYPTVIPANQQNRNYVTINKNQLSTYFIQDLGFPESTIINEPSAITLELETVKTQ